MADLRQFTQNYVRPGYPGMLPEAVQNLVRPGYPGSLPPQGGMYDSNVGYPTLPMPGDPGWGYLGGRGMVSADPKLGEYMPPGPFGPAGGMGAPGMEYMPSGGGGFPPGIDPRIALAIVGDPRVQAAMQSQMPADPRVGMPPGDLRGGGGGGPTAGAQYSVGVGGGLPGADAGTPGGPSIGDLWNAMTGNSAPALSQQDIADRWRGGIGGAGGQPVTVPTQTGGIGDILSGIWAAMNAKPDPSQVQFPQTGLPGSGMRGDPNMKNSPVTAPVTTGTVAGGATAPTGAGGAMQASSVPPFSASTPVSDAILADVQKYMPPGMTTNLNQAPVPMSREAGNRAREKSAPKPAARSKAAVARYEDNNGGDKKRTKRRFNARSKDGATGSNRFEDVPETVNNAALRAEGGRRIAERRRKREAAGNKNA